MRGLLALWRSLSIWWAPGIRVRPTELRGEAPRPGVLFLRRAGEDAAYGAMQCPCGCGETIQLRLFGERPPRWRLTTDAFGRASLSPSVWRTAGCRSHFWLRRGKIEWC